MNQKKSNSLFSTLALKCPHCDEVSMFENPALYAVTNMGTVKDHCDHCGVSLKPETGFYFGAAYVSWALTVALWVTILISLKTLDVLGMIKFGFLTHPGTFLTTGFVTTIILFPYLFRLSRSIWAHMFIKPATDKKPS